MSASLIRLGRIRENVASGLMGTGRIRTPGLRRNIARNSLRNTSLRIFRDFTKVGGML